VRLAIVHPYPWPEVRRGAERYLDDLSRHLAAQGHQVTIVTGAHGPGSLEHVPGAPVVQRLSHLHVRGVHRLGLGEVETFGVPALAALLRGSAEVVHAFTPSAALAGRLARRPTLYTVLGHPEPDQLPPRRAPRALFLAAVRSATVVATLSRASAAALACSTGRRAEVLSPGVRLDRFPSELRARTGPPRILFSASLVDDRKRAPLAVAALARILERHPQARLALSGEGDPARVREAAAQHGARVAAAIDTLGPGAPDEVAARYRAASVTLLPAGHEAFGLALASGTPVACTPDGGMPELIGGEPVGRVAHRATPEAVAEAVMGALALAADPATPQRCVERARRWDWPTEVGPAHERLYVRLAAEVGTTTPSAAGLLRAYRARAT
jgi:glycosyltransferase involved in cell wall biosynthesis